MKPFIVRQISIVKLAAMALITLCSLQTQADAQETNRYIVMFPSVGLAQGQRLRLTLFNPNSEPVRARAMSHHSGGIQVALGDGSVRFVSHGISQSFDLDRSDIPLTGEEGTGRLQLRASFELGIAAPATIERLTVSMETISISDGTSNTVFFAEVVPSAPGSSGGTEVLVGSDARDVLMGIVPGQTLRVTLFNPPPSDSQPQPPRANGHVKVFDGRAYLLAQSDEAVIPSGAFRSFDFYRDSFASQGEQGTHRQQVRVDPIFEFRSQRLSRVLVSFEIVDNRTGKTKVLSGQQCLVFYLGGVPGS
ncbi:MAG TPA: H-X9-DG-CTERM domain-containing protein [Blastocatellia bacterium]|nr:H-X9-DG-CTERM domain-containing protein [Blastocatellia bacterium]